jgi:hypothetical protein
MADVTTLLASAIQKSNEVIDLVKGQFGKWDKRVNDKVAWADSEIKNFKNNVFEYFPITPNILKNTKNFKWKGKNKATFYENTLPDYWSWYNYNGGDTKFKAMVIDITDTNTLNKYNIPHPDKEIPLCNKYGNDVSILYVEIEKTKGNTIFLSQDCVRYTAWGKGNFIIGTKAYFCVIDADGSISIDISNRIAGVGVNANDKGKGWIHKTNHRRGFGGCHQGYIGGSGNLKVAIALPYAYVGYLPDNIHAWAGFIGGKTAYTHSDLIVN